MTLFVGRTVEQSVVKHEHLAFFWLHLLQVEVILQKEIGGASQALPIEVHHKRQQAPESVGVF